MIPPSARRLGLVFALAAAAWAGVRTLAMVTDDHPARQAMQRAEARAEAAFAVVDARKRAAGLPFPERSPVPWAALLGEPYTPLTTTLGSLEAKEVATNPAWAALLVRWLHEAGIAEGDAVGLTASGSFPGLIISALAALREIGARPVLMVSVGSSAYGANSPQATWLDMAGWIAETGLLETSAAAVSIGGESDAGEGLLPEGRRLIEQAAARCGADLVVPQDLDQAIAWRLRILDRYDPRAIVNIGGGQAALGRCRHAATLPGGPWTRTGGCRCRERGVLTRLRERGIPVFHLLEVRDLAARHGLDPQPGRRYGNPGDVYRTVRVRKGWVLAALLLVAIPLVRIRHTGVFGISPDRGGPGL